MEARGSIEEINDAGLPLSSLRLLVPPLRLLSAAMWQVVKQKDVMNYEKLQEFVFEVTEAVPGLINHRQRAQLILGLRARLILELCKGSSRGIVDPQMIQPYLERLPVSSSNAECRDPDVETTEATFIALVQSLLKDPTERAYFFQEVFPVEYGPKYDAALHTLLWELLSKLEKLFPIPDLKQTSAWLGSAPSALEECVQSRPKELSLIYQHHKNSGLLKTPYGPSSTTGSCIMSALSIPPSQKTNISIGLESMHNYANILNPIAFVGADQYSVVTVYTEVEVGSSEVNEEIVESTEEVQEQMDVLQAEVSSVTEDDHTGEDMETTSSRTVGPDESVDIAKALETLTKTFALKKEVVDQEMPSANIENLKEEMAEDIVPGDGITPQTSEQIHLQSGGVTPQTSEQIHLQSGGVTPQTSEQIHLQLGGVTPQTSEQTNLQLGGVTPQTSEQIHLQSGEIADGETGPEGAERNASAEASEETRGDGDDDFSCLNQEVTGSISEIPTSEAASENQQPPSTSSSRRSTRLRMKTSASGRQSSKFKASTKENSGEQKRSTNVSVAPSVIAIKGMTQGKSGEMTSIIFTCPQCPFYNSDENSPPHIHMQTIRTDEYKTLMAAKPDGSVFTPSPCSTDEIFTSIKLFPKGNLVKAEQAYNTVGKDSGGATTSRTQGKRKALTCETCNKTFTRTSDVRRHQLTHTGERPFCCSQCDRTFQHSWDLAKHESRYHGTPISFSCQLCGSTFINLRSLTVHHKKSHSGETKLPQICSICSQSFATASELLEHRKSHGTSLRYICQQCGEGFDSLLERSKHRQTHLVKHQFKCPHCDKTYTRRSDVKRHLTTHTGERPHQCSQCSKRFSLRFMLMKHLKVHTGERPHQCSHCPKRFTLMSILARHERMHTGEKPFLCCQCGKGFLSQGELSKHNKSHVDDRPFSCNQCDKRFKSKKTQQEHIFSHTGARPYPCTYCGKGFTKPYALTRHNLIHTGERPFPCAYCGKTFLSLGEAQLHERIHTGERPYPCNVCDFKFKSSSELARHKRCHAGTKLLKPYCEQCMKTFTSKAKLKAHMATHAEAGEGEASLNS